MNNVATINERDLKDSIIDIVKENEYLKNENRTLEDELRKRPVNILIDKNEHLLFIENGHHSRLSNNVYGNIRRYFFERNLTQTYYQDGIPVVKILLPRKKIYKLMGKGKFDNE